MSTNLSNDIFEVALRDALIELEEIKISESEIIFESYRKKPKITIYNKINILKSNYLKSIACILLVTSISSAIVLNVDAFKYELGNLVYHYYNTHTIITNESLFDNYIPEIDASWNYIYYPSYLPKGYAITKVESNEDLCYIKFTNNKNEQLSYYIEKLFENSNIEIDIDVEDAEISYKTIRDKEVTFIKKYGKCHAYFFYDRIYFSIVSDNLTYRELSKLIGSIDLVYTSERGD